MVDFGIPLFANIHLCGSVLTEVFFVMTLSKVLYGHLPSLGTMILTGYARKHHIEAAPENTI